MYTISFLTALALFVSQGLTQQLESRSLPDGAPATIQDCAAGGNYVGSFTDGSGTYVNSDSVRYAVGKKCWNDYMLVDTTPYTSSWYQVGGNIYCTGTQSCTSGVSNSNQSCFTNTNQISVDIGIEAANLSLGLGYTHTWSQQNCNTDTRTDQCTWNDQGCHVIWAQDRMIRQRGYKRERCNTGGDDFTNCMSDWETTFPTGQVNYGCGSKCGDTNACGNNNGAACPSKRTIPTDFEA